MSSRLRTLALTGLCLAAVLAGPAGGGLYAAAKKSPVPKQPVKGAKEVAKQDFKGREADGLREAYILLATANADYAGHRHKAMGAIESAVTTLDRSVLKKGTAGQKAATLAHDSAAARAKIVDKYVKVPKGVKEPQAISDLHLRAAAQLLGEIRGTLAQNNQKGPFGQVEKALREISMALEVR